MYTWQTTILYVCLYIIHIDRVESTTDWVTALLVRGDSGHYILIRKPDFVGRGIEVFFLFFFNSPRHVRNKNERTDRTI